MWPVLDFLSIRLVDDASLAYPRLVSNENCCALRMSVICLGGILKVCICLPFLDLFLTNFESGNTIDGFSDIFLPPRNDEFSLSATFRLPESTL